MDLLELLDLPRQTATNLFRGLGGDSEADSLSSLPGILGTIGGIGLSSLGGLGAIPSILGGIGLGSAAQGIGKGMGVKEFQAPTPGEVGRNVFGSDPEDPLASIGTAVATDPTTYFNPFNLLLPLLAGGGIAAMMGPGLMTRRLGQMEKAGELIGSPASKFMGENPALDALTISRIDRPADFGADSTGMLLDRYGTIAGLDPSDMKSAVASGRPQLVEDLAREMQLMEKGTPFGSPSDMYSLSKGYDPEFASKASYFSHDMGDMPDGISLGIETPLSPLTSLQQHGLPQAIAHHQYPDPDRVLLDYTAMKEAMYQGMSPLAGFPEQAIQRLSPISTGAIHQLPLMENELEQLLKNMTASGFVPDEDMVRLVNDIQKVRSLESLSNHAMDWSDLQRIMGSKVNPNIAFEDPMHARETVGMLGLAARQGGSVPNISEGSKSVLQSLYGGIDKNWLQELLQRVSQADAKRLFGHDPIPPELAELGQWMPESILQGGPSGNELADQLAQIIQRVGVR